MRVFTTADCVEAITAKAPSVIPNIVRDFKPVWKRLSKTGKKGGPITRVFGANSAPFLNAIVIEEAGTLDVRFVSLPLWKVGNDDVDWAAYERPDVRALLSVSASDFVYALGFENEELCGVAHVWIAVTPVDYWKREGYAYDGHLDIASILPRNADGSEAGEEMEATFSIFGKTLEQVDAEMKALGFVDDPDYKAFIARTGE